MNGIDIYASNCPNYRFPHSYKLLRCEMGHAAARLLHSCKDPSPAADILRQPMASVPRPHGKPPVDDGRDENIAQRYCYRFLFRPLLVFRVELP